MLWLNLINLKTLITPLEHLGTNSSTKKMVQKSKIKSS
jgi:hypothetical protein